MHAKFNQNNNHLKYLLNTGTRQSESSAIDCYYGIGLLITNINILDVKSWDEDNCLGNILMELRTSLNK